ncbi:MAG: hypothetical protein ACP5GW_05560 [Caldisericaceae bacterium]
MKNYESPTIESAGSGLVVLFIYEQTFLAHQYHLAVTTEVAAILGVAAIVAAVALSVLLSPPPVEE